MGRVSQAQAQQNRRRVVDEASRLFREQGTEVSVADLMKAAGMTHGGFYKQFASKQALVGEATANAFAEHAHIRAAAVEQHPGDSHAAQKAFIDGYLSTEHRDSAADGCPIAGLAIDIARGHGDDKARRVFTEQVRDTATWLDDSEAGQDGENGLTRLCTMVGALILARATDGDPLSEDILTTTREALTGR